jgi:hypothetical protein
MTVLRAGMTVLRAGMTVLRADDGVAWRALAGVTAGSPLSRG